MKKAVSSCFFISVPRKKTCSHINSHTNKKCGYTVFADDKCIFHCEKDDWFVEKKDVSGNMKRDWTRSREDGRIVEFWKLIREKKMTKEDYDFSGYVFPKDSHFVGVTFSGEANFRDVIFLEDVYFDRVKFLGTADLLI